HLLLETRQANLSLIMKQINSIYSIYFNRKTKRVGPLWQGRFKSWLVYNDNYLVSLVKYIEVNPVKAQIAVKAGEYPWAMSSRAENLECADFGLVDKIDFKVGLSDQELKNVEAVFKARFEVEAESMVSKKDRKSLSEHFEEKRREVAVARAIKGGYTQVAIGEYLGLSNIAISKIFKIYRARCCLFNRLRDMGVFWSYSKEIDYDQAGTDLFIEYLLKYGDFDDIRRGFELFGKRLMEKVWQARVAGDYF
ncbi:MAG: hypothetical protein U9N77_17325, partial [Thermodesulfobacteriota bacterium]|nr:hypothetical protein [Thermodesulfobacteriota bacterium]